MKKLKFQFCVLSTMLASFTVANDLPAFFQNNNTQLINHKTTYNNLNSINEFKQINSASMDDYGPLQTELDKKYRATRLMIKMTPPMYNYFLNAIDTDTQKSFIFKFLGPETPYLAPEWKNTQKKIKDVCESASKARNLSDSYFYNKFLHWLMSEEGWNYFKNVFIGKNLKNNIYDMHVPGGYNELKAQYDFRTQGVVLQFPFRSLDTEQRNWKVQSKWMIYPQNDKILGLLQYYRSKKVEHGIVSLIPPIMQIKLPKTPTKEMTVQDLFFEIKDVLNYNFNVPEYVRKYRLIRIPPSECSALVSLDRYNPTIIHLNFYALVSIPSFYISKNIRLYATGPTI